MASSSTDDQQKLERLRIRCKELGVLTSDKEETLDILASVSIRLAIKKAEEDIAKSEVVKACMQNTYGKTKDNFKQPPIDLNKAVVPSVGGNARQITIKDSEGDLKKVSMKIPAVKIEVDCEKMWVDVNNVTIPVESSDGIWHKSILGAKLNEPFKLTYANEFKIQSYCEDMIMDALRALGLLDEADTHLEFSMYLMKPDIVVVVKHQGRVFFAVEVKSPEVGDKKKVFGNEMVAGQIWSYLYAMKAAGNPCPIGAIMTYNKISIVTLGDYTKNEQGEESEKHKTRIKTAEKCLSTGRSPKRELPEAIKEKCETREDSPIKPSKDFNKTNREDNEEMQQELTEKAVERNAYCSRVHEEGEVFPCLLQAIEIAYRGIRDADAEQVVRVEVNAPIGRRFVFKLGEASFDWVQLGGKVLAAIDGNLPRKGTKHLYILGKLGDGGIASVYLACSLNGRVCAIKDYCIERSNAANDAKRDEEEDSERMLVIGKAEEEEGRWATIYGHRFQARAQCLGGKHSLLMPYGHQIADEPDDRWQRVSGIKNELKLFAQCTKKVEGGRPGYKYKKSDLRWRHVLLDSEKKIFLCDLESLEEIGENESSNEVVYEQLAILLRPMRNERQERDTLNWLLGSKTADVVSFICGIESLKNFFEGSSRDGHTEGTEQYGEILESLFPSTATFKGLSANPRAVVTLCMISHYKSSQSAKRQRESSESEISIPALENSPCDEEALGSEENPEDAEKVSKRTKTKV